VPLQALLLGGLLRHPMLPVPLGVELFRGHMPLVVLCESGLTSSGFRGAGRQRYRLLRGRSEVQPQLKTWPALHPLQAGVRLALRLSPAPSPPQARRATTGRLQS
jgi:hypothetical protein